MNYCKIYPKSHYVGYDFGVSLKVMYMRSALSAFDLI